MTQDHSSVCESQETVHLAASVRLVGSGMFGSQMTKVNIVSMSSRDPSLTNLGPVHS